MTAGSHWRKPMSCLVWEMTPVTGQATKPWAGAVDHDWVMVVLVCLLVHPGEVQSS